MGLIIAMVFILTTTVYSEKEVEETKDLSYTKGSRYFYFPGDGNGKLYQIDTLEPVSRSAITGTDNTYWLYTRLNPIKPQELKINDKDSALKSNFDPSKTTVIIAHGWKGSVNITSNKILIPAFLENGDVNVICVDYSADANQLYILAILAVAEVGKGLGEFINWLTTLGMSLERTHVVGFSLGAHVVGVAGRFNNGTIRRITALDPAGPLWYGNSDRIQNTDAQYVEVIHTNMFLFGYDGQIGDADFYPNGGIFMPECMLNSCSHYQAYHYMAETLKYNNLIANECENIDQVNEDLCKGTTYPMGNSDLTKNRTGMFRVDTGVIS